MIASSYGDTWWMVVDPYLTVASSLYCDATSREFNLGDTIPVRRAQWPYWRVVVIDEERTYLVRWGRVVSPLAAEKEEE